MAQGFLGRWAHDAARSGMLELAAAHRSRAQRLVKELETESQ